MIYHARVKFGVRVPRLASDARLQEGMDRLEMKTRAARMIYHGVQVAEPWWQVMGGNPWRRIYDSARTGQCR